MKADIIPIRPGLDPFQRKPAPPAPQPPPFIPTQDGKPGRKMAHVNRVLKRL